MPALRVQIPQVSRDRKGLLQAMVDDAAAAGKDVRLFEAQTSATLEKEKAAVLDRLGTNAGSALSDVVGARVERFDRRGTEPFEPFEPFEFFQNRNFP